MENKDKRQSTKISRLPFLWIHKLVWQDKRLKSSDLVIYGTLALLVKNDSQECHPSLRTLASLSRLTKNTVLKSLKKLKECGYIEIKKNKNKNNVYVLLQPEVIGSSIIEPGGGSKIEPPVVQNETPNNMEYNNNIIIINNNKQSENLTAFSLKEKIEKYLKSKRREIQIIALLIKHKPVILTSEEQLQSFIKRNLRPAKLLVGYSDELIIETIKAIKQSGYISKWGLETVLKFIDDVQTELLKQKQKPKIIGWERVDDKTMRAIFENKIKKEEGGSCG